MKEELHLKRLTHIEKLDMFISHLKSNKERHQALWSTGKALHTKDPVELINMMHDYKRYNEEIMKYPESDGIDNLIEEIPYNKKMIELYINTEIESGVHEKSLFGNNKRQIEEDAKAMAQALYFKMGILGTFKYSNNRIFKINESLIDKLKLTDVNTDISYIRTPYECIYIQFPPKFSSYTYSEGVYIQQWKPHGEENKNALMFFPVDKFKFDPKKWTNSRNILTSAVPSTIDLSKKITIKDVINNYNNNNGTFDSFRGDEDTLLISTIIKILMYISSINADTEKRTPNLNILTKKKKLLKKGKTTIPYEYVGGNIIINNHNNFENGSGNGTGRQITTKFMVRGHYRGFWMNLNDDIPNHQIVDIKDDKMLVRKWVEPFWKGSEFAEVVLKDYKVN